MKPKSSSQPDRLNVKARLKATSIKAPKNSGQFFEVTYQGNQLQKNSLKELGIRVSAPEIGFEQQATLVRLSLNKQRTVAKLRYKLNAPGGSWDFPDNAVYRVFLQQGKGSRRNPGKKLSFFQVDIPDAISPTARIASLPLLTNRSAPYEFGIAYSDNAAIKVATLDSADIQVTGPKGFSQKATFVRVDAPSDGKSRIAIYRINPRKGTWSPQDNGNYSIALLPNQVTDAGNNPLPPGVIGSFSIDINSKPPTATLAAPTLSFDGGSSYDFTVTYSDVNGINIATLDGNDIEVTSPKGYRQKATLVALDTPSLGTPRTATYRITAPGGFWDGADDSTYTVSQVANQVSDGLGNARPTEALGTFKVALTVKSLNGSDKAETIGGGAENNVIRGFGGNDLLRGNNGNDILLGGIGNDTIDGGNGTDTVSYSDAVGSMTVDLAAGISSRVARIMPLGDSITLGVTNSNLNRLNGTDPARDGGYRSVLWQNVVQSGLAIDFVGGEAGGPERLGDKDHEGHGGKTIDFLFDEVNGYLARNQPDIVLVMAGTNDTFTRDSAARMIQELSGLIDKITNSSANIRVLVASIPPVQPDADERATPAQQAAQLQKIKDYNAAIPQLVNSKKAAGKAVEFVEMRSAILGETVGLTRNDISPHGGNADSGVHPNSQGYTKIGNLWFNGLVNKVGIAQNTFKVDSDQLVSIENVSGSAFNDDLIGSAASNVIQGGGGIDRLTGNGGTDTFFYRRPSDANDTITDFSSDDLLRISASGFGGGLVGGVSLSSGAATTGVLVNGNTPISANPTFLYTNGILWFDVDGTGSTGRVPIATLANQPASLELNQFQIVS
ncbi:hypothetical protein IFO70_05665 [Phormidium tenue FACHB-886]|nr:hypothetical protein [Phormidium tenue FACHB-886]